MTLPPPDPIRDPALSGAFRIDRDGAWRHEGVEVTHPGVLRNLFANLRSDGEDYYLQVGSRRVPVQVDDTAFVVVRAASDDLPGTVEAYLTDGSREPLDLETLVLSRRGVPYCRVKNGRFPARLSVAAWLQLADKIELDPASGAPVLILGSRRMVLRSSD
jgi:hypothetical protein